MLDTVANVLGILTAVIVVARWVWQRYGERLEDWYFIARYQLTRPFKPPPVTKATITAHVVGRVRTRRNPYTGEEIISRVYFDKE